MKGENKVAIKAIKTQLLDVSQNAEKLTILAHRTCELLKDAKSRFIGLLYKQNTKWTQHQERNIKIWNLQHVSHYWIKIL